MQHKYAFGMAYPLSKLRPHWKYWHCRHCIDAVSSQSTLRLGLPAWACRWQLTCFALWMCPKSLS